MLITKKKLNELCQKLEKKKWKDLFCKVFSYPENIELFVVFFFPHVMTSKTPAFHKEIYESLLEDNNSAIAAPRGHAKSTITGLFFIVWCVVNGLEQYIVYISQSHAKTVQFLSPIREEFKNNLKLKYVYGDMTPRAARDEDGKDREDCFDVNKIRIEAVSFEKNLRGFKYNNIRPTLIVGDDIEDDTRVLNPELRVKDANKLNKIIIPSLDIDGRFKFIGTLLHIDSLLAKKIQQYSGKIYKACNRDLTNILWADRFTKEKLQKIKTDIGSVAFEQEYLNNPINTTNNLIEGKWLEKCKDASLSYDDACKLEYSYKTEGTDFAFSDRITADRSAYIGLGEIRKQYVVFLCDAQKGLSISEQMARITEFYKRYKFDAMGLEENSIKSISKDISSYGMPITLFWTGATDPAARLKPSYNWFGKRHTVGKQQMIMRLATAFENEEIVLPYKTDEDKRITEEIISECMSYALSEGKLVEATVHPDIPIALGYALELHKNMERTIIDWGGGMA